MFDIRGHLLELEDFVGKWYRASAKAQSSKATKYFHRRREVCNKQLKRLWGHEAEEGTGPHLGRSDIQYRLLHKIFCSDFGSQLPNCLLVGIRRSRGCTGLNIDLTATVYITFAPSRLDSSRPLVSICSFRGPILATQLRQRRSSHAHSV
jgi:hypothetical protein